MGTLPPTLNSQVRILLPGALEIKILFFMHFTKICTEFLRNFAQILKLTARFRAHVSALPQPKHGVALESLRYGPSIFSGGHGNDFANAMLLSRRHCTPRENIMWPRRGAHQNGDDRLE